MSSAPNLNESTLRVAVILLTFAAFALRIWQIDTLPPGWRDDELINSLVISQKVLDGNWAVYYPDASGHEALYHVLNALPLRLFGPGALGIRLTSVFLGTLTVPILFVTGRRLLGAWAGLVAAAALTFSFWSLMYSRIGLRHILMPFLTTAAFFFFWRGLISQVKVGWKLNLRNFLLAALFIGLGLYTYFAARGIPLVLLAFVAYLWLFDRRLLRRRWRELLVLFSVLLLMAIPLLVTLGRQPDSEARVAELALPLVEGTKGNFAPLAEYFVTTMRMFHSTGDAEWLYNIPNRPVFGFVGALFFWLGVATAVYSAARYTIRAFPFRRSKPTAKLPEAERTRALASVFLLLWWLAGISPAFVSVPPASLGHTIIAQPAVFILMALPLQEAWTWSRVQGQARQLVTLAISLVLLTGIAWRDLPAYFEEWPQRGMVRFLYRADIQDVAEYLNERPDLEDFGIAGLLAGPWDKLALQIDLNEARVGSVRPRWFNPERVILLQPPLSFVGFPEAAQRFEDVYQSLPGTDRIGAYTLRQTTMIPSEERELCFLNGLCLLDTIYDQEEDVLLLSWRVERQLDLPPIPLISNPPPPGVYSGPRLRVFAQLLNADGEFLAGDDGFWVDPTTLQAGDAFVQQHRLVAPEGKQSATIVFGLYDPMTGERTPTVDGRDHLQLEVGD